MSDETWHHGVLAAACDVYDACRYLEIGVGGGACLNAVAPHAAASVGVDPHKPTQPVGLSRFWQGTSDAYFDALLPGDRFDVIFIDGDHSLEQATRDFENAVRHLVTGGVIYLHDVHPLSDVDTRERVACGEVYLLAGEIRADRRFESWTWTRFPGLMAVRNLEDSIDESKVVP